MKYQSIVRVKIQGACGGVRKAIETARQVRRDHPEEKVTVLGELVHNRFVMEDLAAAGIRTVEGKGAAGWSCWMKSATGWLSLLPMA